MTPPVVFTGHKLDAPARHLRHTICSAYLVMNIATIFLPSIARLTDYVRRQYNCTFNFQDAENLESELALNPGLEARLHNESIVVDGDWVCFPIFSPPNPKLVGVARISRSEKIGPTDLAAIEKIIRYVFASRLEGAATLFELEATEKSLREYEKNQGAKAADRKVVQLSWYKKNPVAAVKLNPPPALNFPFLIQSSSAEDIFKMALEIHSQSQRYAFLSLNDLDPTALESVKKINGLGEITVFIPDIAGVTALQQAQLELYYSSPRDKISAQFVAGSTLPIGELKKSNKVSSQLLSQLMIGYLCLTQPFAAYKRENMLEFFFDSLSGRIYHE